MQLRLALPKGQLLSETSALLQRKGLELSGYFEGSRSYHLKSTRFPYLVAKVFQEKDIPIQVAVGNYDLGICGLDWIEELLVKYPDSSLAKVRNLGYGRGNLYLAASEFMGISSLEELKATQITLRIASEYPNLAEAFALNLRLRKFKIFPIWGAAEVYPPESVDLIIFSETGVDRFYDHDLVPLATILPTQAFLIANRSGWEKADMSEVLGLLCEQEIAIEGEELLPNLTRGALEKPRPHIPRVLAEDSVCLALPDGHQQRPTSRFLSKAGLKIEGYSEVLGNRRPIIDLVGVTIKVTRPQDMPLQVANGNFDLAITGRDWLLDHLYCFPSSPVRELLDLKFGKVKIVAVVSKDLPVDNVQELGEFMKEGRLPSLRIASEYVNIADKYARDNHLVYYKVIPTWGASEAFLPDDADLLIENTQTGETLARHDLRIIDTLFESTACLIGSEDSYAHPAKREKVDYIIEILQSTVAREG